LTDQCLHRSYFIIQDDEDHGEFAKEGFRHTMLKAHSWSLLSSLQNNRATYATQQDIHNLESDNFWLIIRFVVLKLVKSTAPY